MKNNPKKKKIKQKGFSKGILNVPEFGHSWMLLRNATKKKAS